MKAHEHPPDGAEPEPGAALGHRAKAQLAGLDTRDLGLAGALAAATAAAAFLGVAPSVLALGLLALLVVD